MKELIKQLTVQKFYRFYPTKRTGDLSKESYGAGEKIKIDILSSQFEGQKIKFVEYQDGTVQKWLDEIETEPKIESKATSKETPKETLAETIEEDKAESKSLKKAEIIEKIKELGFNDIDESMNKAELKEILSSLEDQ